MSPVQERQGLPLLPVWREDLGPAVCDRQALSLCRRDRAVPYLSCEGKEVGGAYRLPFRSGVALEGKGFHVHCLNSKSLTLPAPSCSSLIFEVSFSPLSRGHMVTSHLELQAG